MTATVNKARYNDYGACVDERRRRAISMQD